MPIFEKAFRAETFEEMAVMSRDHGMGMLEQGEQAHVGATEELKHRVSEEGALWLSVAGANPGPDTDDGYSSPGKILITLPSGSSVSR